MAVALWRAVVPANADSKMSDPVSLPPSSSIVILRLRVHVLLHCLPAYCLLADTCNAHCLIVHERRNSGMMTLTKRPKVTDLYAFLLCLLLACSISSAFTSPPASASHHDRSLTVLNGKRKGGLKKSLEGDPKSLNQGRGQEITGVTLPAEGKIKGWEFGNNMRIAAAQVEGNFYAVQGECPRCAFDLWKGTLVTDEAFGPDLPRVACPTCATTFSFKTGTHGPALKRTGLSGFVGKLTKTATVNDASRDAQAYIITRDSETEQVFCKER